MISRLRLVLLALFSTAVLATAGPQEGPQVSGLDTHPACRVVFDYLTMILTRQYNKGADIMDEGYLTSLQSEYVDRIKRAPTMEDEEVMLRRIGKSAAEEISKMKPREFFTAYNLGLQAEHPVPEEMLAIVRKTLSFKVLSVAQETDKLVHVLVRSKNSNGKALFESLDLISLVKNGDKWQIALNVQAPKITPLDENGNPAPGRNVDPVKGADPVKKAGTDPGKPATPPKPAGPKRKPNP